MDFEALITFDPPILTGHRMLLEREKTLDEDRSFFEDRAAYGWTTFQPAWQRRLVDLHSAPGI